MIYCHDLDGGLRHVEIPIARQPYDQFTRCILSNKLSMNSKTMENPISCQLITIMSYIIMNNKKFKENEHQELSSVIYLK